MSRVLVRIFLSAIFALTCTTGIITHQLRAQTIDELQQNIVDSASQINSLKIDIAKLQNGLIKTGKQKQTLQTMIKTADLNIQKFTKSILLTTTQINQKDKEINRLTGGIATTTNKIGSARSDVGITLSLLDAHDQEPLSLLMLGGTSLSDFFNQAAVLESIRLSLQGKISTLSTLKTNLQSSKDVAQLKREELNTLQNNLAEQKQSLAIARQSQSELLTQTKNTEIGYQKTLTEKKAEQKKFEQDLRSFESQLNLKVSKSSLPQSGTGSLAWPIDDPMITQYFGNTPFATANPQVYNAKGHNAIDLRASPGSVIKSARAGIILGTGNTDVTCPGSSYGKWVFIQHDNGLSTLYAHLSVIKVSKGDHVDMGETVGLSGATGYATGPHLHFGVYASSGAEIASFPSKSCTGRTYTMPVADISAYLNPLSYLSKI